MRAVSQTPPCRRLSSRFETADDVWVYWRCNEAEDLSRVRDLSAGGLFLSTQAPRPQGERLTMDFLVQEGRIRAEAIVQRTHESTGLGLKFTAIIDQDRPRLAALLGRVRSCSTSAETRSKDYRGGPRGALSSMTSAEGRRR